MSLLKSLAFTPTEATIAMFHSSSSSSSRVFLQRTCSPFRNGTSVSLFYYRGCSSVKAFSFFNTMRYCTYSGDEYGSSSKRRSRGTVMAAKKTADGEKQEEGRYKHTVDLPKTGFCLRANSLTREPEIQKMWDDSQVFKRAMDQSTGGNFILHDGPPYANGDLHIGHAMKILQNYKVHFVPGWDCHGLPIELKVLQSLDDDARKDLTPLKLRAKAAKFAKANVKTQMASFKCYGVWADWGSSYLTLDPEYEAAQVDDSALLHYACQC